MKTKDRVTVLPNRNLQGTISFIVSLNLSISLMEDHSRTLLRLYGTSLETTDCREDDDGRVDDTRPQQRSLMVLGTRL